MSSQIHSIIIKWKFSCPCPSTAGTDTDRANYANPSKTSVAFTLEICMLLLVAVENGNPSMNVKRLFLHLAVDPSYSLVDSMCIGWWTSR
jgi:hypothetical protein